MSSESSMRAVRIHGIEDYRLEDIPVPSPGDGEILVQVLAVGICASDAKCFTGAAKYWGTPEKPARFKPVVTPGHEFSGKVVELGPGADVIHKVKVGDLVVSEQIVPCQVCKYCKKGTYQMCTRHHVYGFNKLSEGAMAEYMIFPKTALVHVVPSDMDPLHAAFVEPLACSLHAVEIGNVQWNDIVVISGCGPLGLGMVAAAKMKQPKVLIALDMFDWKLDLAKECGADVVINPGTSHLRAEIDKLTDGLGCDIYIEATGAESSVRQGLQIIARQGTFIEFSVFGKEVTADWSIIGDEKELTIKGGHLGPYCWPKAISMISKGMLPMDKIITHKFKLEEYETGIRKVCASKDSIKVMLVP